MTSDTPALIFSILLSVCWSCLIVDFYYILGCAIYNSRYRLIRVWFIFAPLCGESKAIKISRWSWVIVG